MTAPDQLARFDPDRVDALRLLSSYVAQAEKQEAAAERFELLLIPAAARAARALASDAVESACVLGMYLGFLELAGLD